jgi:hypothetical protein
MELFTQLHALNPKQWTDFKSFGKRYCMDKSKNNPSTTTKSLHSNHNKYSHWGDNIYKGANNLQELHVLLTATLMIRRQKINILTQLPKKKRYIINVSIEDNTVKQSLEKILEELANYQELEHRTNKKRKNRKRQIKYMDDDDAFDNINDDNNDEEKHVMKAQEKSLLMELFTRSGPAKLPAVLKQIDTFLEDELSGKVSFIHI